MKDKYGKKKEERKAFDHKMRENKNIDDVE